MDKSCFKNPEDKARNYSRIKYGLVLAEAGFFLAFCIIWQATGFSQRLGHALSRMAATADPLIGGPVFLLLFFLVYYILAFPGIFYRTFLLEHQFGLSKETLKGWFLDQLKSGLIACLIASVCLDAFYLIFNAYPQGWWLCLSAGFLAFNLIFAYLVPVVVMPLFFKYTRFPQGPMRMRLTKLAQSMGISFGDIYYINFSKRTVKANAGLMGLGNTKRIVLSDTLQKVYTDDEILVLAAHEFAHSRSGHIIKLLFLSACIYAGLFYVLFKIYPALSDWGKLPPLADPAGIPTVFLCLALWGMASEPVMNAVSRRFESHADEAAIRSTGLATAFVSSMEKLADQNLADRDPPALFVWLFYSHPPVSERIAKARMERE